MRQPPQQRELTVEEASGLCHFVVTDIAESDRDLEHCVDLRRAAGRDAEEVEPVTTDATVPLRDVEEQRAACAA